MEKEQTVKVTINGSEIEATIISINGRNVEFKTKPGVVTLHEEPILIDGQPGVITSRKVHLAMKYGIHAVRLDE